VLVRNRIMSVAAVMRTLMQADSELPVPPYLPGEPMWAPAIGEVVTAPGTDLAPGDLVSHYVGWREFALADAGAVQRIDQDALPDVAAYLSQGFTAWLGVVRAAEVRPGDTVFVTGVAGGVGTLAGQFAKLRGAARVIGSTGSRRKGRYLVEELGYDAVVIRGADPQARPGGLGANRFRRFMLGQQPHASPAARRVCRRRASWISSARSGVCQSAPSSEPMRSSRCTTVLTCTCSTSLARVRFPPAAK
jgi:hypothetical protein